MSLLQLLFQFFFAPFIGVELTASPEQFSYPTLTDHSYRIVQDAEGTGSCFDYSVYDDQGRVTLPREVQDELYCNPTLTIADSYPLLLHIGGNWNLNIYNLATEQLTTLMTFHPDTDGLECQFSPSDTTIACVSVNQERYDELTRIFILDITPRQAPTPPHRRLRLRCIMLPSVHLPRRPHPPIPGPQRHRRPPENPHT